MLGSNGTTRSPKQAGHQPATIGTIWQILYPIILVSFGYVFFLAAVQKSAGGLLCRSGST